MTGPRYLLALTGLLTLSAACSDGTLEVPEEGANGADLTSRPTERHVLREWRFDTGSAGWALEYAADEAGESQELLEASSLSAVPASEVAPARLMLSTPIDAPKKKTQISVKLPRATNLTGVTLKARVKLASGLGQDSPGGVTLYAKSSPIDFVYSDGGWNNLTTDSGWITVLMRLDSPVYPAPGAGEPRLDASQVTELGIQVSAGDDGTFTPATVLVERVWLEADVAY